MIRIGLLKIDKYRYKARFLLNENRTSRGQRED